MTFALSYLSVRPSVSIYSSAPTGQIFVKFDIGDMKMLMSHILIFVFIVSMCISSVRRRLFITSINFIK